MEVKVNMRGKRARINKNKSEKEGDDIPRSSPENFNVLVNKIQMAPLRELNRKVIKRHNKANKK